MNDRIGWLYVLYAKHDPSHYRYIGISVDPKARMRQHRSKARTGADTPLYRWMRKYGVENIVMSIETEVPIEYDSLLQYEIDSIARYRQAGHDLLNLTTGGEGVTGVKFSDAEIQRRRDSMTGSNNPQYGKSSPETGLRNQQLKTGEPGYWLGRTRSPETRRKMSETNRGRRVETKINEDIVREIRGMFEAGVMQKEIAERFNVSRQLVCNVLKRRRWGWVE